MESLQLTESDIETTIRTMPEVLYKYRDYADLNHKKLLFNQELYFASANQLNDPFDGGITFRYKKEQLTAENIFRKTYLLLKDANPSWDETQLHSAAYELQRQDELLTGTEDEKFQHQVKSDLNRTFGIVSLSKIPNDLLMWAHYSKSHSGFCIGLEIRYVFKNFGPKLNLAEMIYREDMPEIDLFEHPVTFYAKLLGTKSFHWQYEKEVRLIRRGFVRRSLNITHAAVKEIYLGATMAVKEKLILIQKLKTVYPEIKIFDCSLSKDRFEVKTDRIF